MEDLELYISKEEFLKVLKNLKNYIFSKDINSQIIDKTLIENIFKSENVISLNTFFNFANSSNNKIERAVLFRILLVQKVRYTHNNSQLSNLKKLKIVDIWNLIYYSIFDLNKDELISSVGSQGFLSIPLYRYETKTGELDLLRLHIWDKSLDKYINSSDLLKFSIHSHKFNVQSWVLYGQIYNNRYFNDYRNTDFALNYFKIGYEKPSFDKNDNNRISSLLNTGINAKVKEYVSESYKSGDTYQLNAGEFHFSDVNQDYDINASLFLFSSKKGIVDSSYVLGDKNLKKAPNHPHIKFDCKYLVEKLDRYIQNERK